MLVNERSPLSWVGCDDYFLRPLPDLDPPRDEPPERAAPRDGPLDRGALRAEPRDLGALPADDLDLGALRVEGRGLGALRADGLDLGELRVEGPDRGSLRAEGRGPGALRAEDRDLGALRSMERDLGAFCVEGRDRGTPGRAARVLGRSRRVVGGLDSCRGAASRRVYLDLAAPDPAPLRLVLEGRNSPTLGVDGLPALLPLGVGLGSAGLAPRLIREASARAPAPSRPARTVLRSDNCGKFNLGLVLPTAFSPVRFATAPRSIFKRCRSIPRNRPAVRPNSRR